MTLAEVETEIERLVSVVNRAIARGDSAPIALAALETLLINLVRKLDASERPS